MNPESFRLRDVHRLLFGTEPRWFIVEVLARSIVVYVLLLVVLRILGKRLTGQITVLDMAIMITLGGIVSAPMVLPDKGIVIGLVLLLCVLGFERGMGRLGVTWERFELAAHGEPQTLVKNGILLVDELRANGLSRNLIWANLRSEGIFHLGEIERVYIEPGGSFTIWKAETPKPGLSVFPEGELTQDHRTRHADGRFACASCGTVVTRTAKQCDCCGEDRWVQAVESEQE